MRATAPAPKDGPRINDDIRVREVHLIDKDGANRGNVTISEALAIAQEAGLDLVEISPNATPPVCKLLDFGKYKFQEQKKQAEARKKQKVVEVKEIKFRPMIDDHDYEVKMRAMQRFFEEGDKVKVTLRFRGREMAHQELGARLLERVKGRYREARQNRDGRPFRRAPDDHDPGAALEHFPLNSFCHGRALSRPSRSVEDSSPG